MKTLDPVFPEKEPRSDDARCLIVTADDFGLSRGVNRGIRDAHEAGIVTSASLMVRGIAAEEAAESARARPALSVGLHVDLGEWAYLAGHWFPIYEVVPAHSRFHTVEDAVLRQFEAFTRLMGRWPTHIDSHQHCHRREPLRSILRGLCARLGIPLRQHFPGVTYWGYFFGQTLTGRPYPEGITIAHLTRLIGGLAPGITELSCHPGYPDGLISRYREERAVELRTLSAPEVREALESGGIRLIPYGEVCAESEWCETGSAFAV